MPKVYSFKDITGAFAHPLAGGFSFAGKIGLGQITITMSTEQTSQDVASDGNVLVSAISGDNGQIALEVQQTSDLHSFLMAWFNLIKTAKDSGDVTNYANAALTIRSLTDNSLHIATGIAPTKIPDKAYASQAQKLTWVLMAADIQSN